MSWPWFKNEYLSLVTGPVSNEEMEHIPYPLFELAVHVTQRMVQVGSVLGGISAVAYRLVKYNATDNLRVSLAAKRIAGSGALLGVVVGPVLTVASMYTQSDEAIYDRCYRLRNNHGQVLVDRFATPMGIVGAVARGAPGFAWGTNAGLLSYLIYKYLFVTAKTKGMADMDSPIFITTKNLQRSSGLKMHNDESAPATEAGACAVMQ